MPLSALMPSTVRYQGGAAFASAPGERPAAGATTAAVAPAGLGRTRA
ncbi:hypothetical protein LHJ74_31520 [Streptomyces sp. N2-109]|uniref:Uncharacterized protein n=1 Tax=Streptomyces gossypii TaxID=2883101 RepID=A0ABT2K342_9ACTN|nr:hypothetical protein [Streptomyces gossypii]MCT2594386.1 hypothetical protein [Streptomyces gossypii]